MRVQIPESEVKELLTDVLGKKPTRKLLSEFKDYLDIDVPQWLRDNAKAFMRKLVEEDRRKELGD